MSFFRLTSIRCALENTGFRPLIRIFDPAEQGIRRKEKQGNMMEDQG
jgi:hypothetical protein